jgi:repressor LexA
VVLSKKDVGVLVKNAREERTKNTGKKYTQQMLADDLDISRGYLGDIENGRTYPNYVLLSKIAEACGVPFNYFERESQLPDDKRSSENLIPVESFSKVPVLGVIRAGEPMYAEQNITSYVPVPNEYLNGGGEYFGLQVKGDSMNNSHIVDGCIVVVRKQEYVENDEVAVVLVDGEEATVKIFYKTDTLVTLMPNSNNPLYKPRSIDLTKIEVKILGKVVFMMKQIN